MIVKDYSGYIRFGSPRHNEIEDWLIENKSSCHEERQGVYRFSFPMQEVANKFSIKYPTFKEITHA